MKKRKLNLPKYSQNGKGSMDHYWIATTQRVGFKPIFIVTTKGLNFSSKLIP